MAVDTLCTTFKSVILILYCSLGNLGYNLVESNKVSSMMLLQIQQPQTANTAPEMVVGIDLGTTNSLIAYVKQQPQILSIEGSNTMPSVVNYQAGQISVGQAALQQTQGITFRSIKRLMGKNLSELTEQELQQWPLAPDPQRDKLVTFQLGSDLLTPISISAQILRQLKQSAERALHTEVRRAIITVPAYFDEAARSATKHAAALAGLTAIRLLNEPTAAALAYGLDKQLSGKYAIYDLGGGTFDISILQLQEGIFQVLGTGGDRNLGGDDLDLAIAEQRHWSREVARTFKEQLSAPEAAEIAPIIQPYIDRTIQLITQLLQDLQLTTADIDGVVLVGGSTRLALVRQALGQLFGAAKILTDLNPEEVVAMGAAIYAQSLVDQTVQRNLLLDVCPLSLGIETLGGLVEKIIPRNTPIPYSTTMQFTTYYNNQTKLKINVVQGERPMVNECRPLAEFILANIPPLPAGEAVLSINFSLDANNFLTVTAKEEKSGIQQTVKVQPASGLTEAEIKQMLTAAHETQAEDNQLKAKTECEIMLKQL